MFAPDKKHQMNDENGVGEGYLLVDGQDIERVKIAMIMDFDTLYEDIRKAMDR